MRISIVEKLDGIEMEINPEILYPANYGELVIHFNSENRNFGNFATVIQFNLEYAGNQQLGNIFINANIIEDFSELTTAELANPPQISVNNKTLIIKDLNPEELRTEVIEVENIGTRDLHIRNIQTSDKRFSIAPSKFVVNPGKKSSFNISIKPDDSIKKLKSIITIISNDPMQSIINFTIVGEVDLPEGSSAKEMVIEIQVGKAKNIIHSNLGKDEFVILDVRTEEEYSNGYIENAINLNFYDTNFKKMLKLMDKQKTYLVYCQSGIRSKKTVDFMSEMGYKKIYHMHEGIAGWEAMQMKLIAPQK